LATEPYTEPVALSALRFALEVAAWIAIYFAWGWIPLALAIATLSLCSVPGDKHMVVIRVNGPTRILLEALVAACGIAAARLAWSVPAALVLLTGFIVLFALSRSRLRWLWHH
jgi:hypothetical protein